MLSAGCSCILLNKIPAGSRSPALQFQRRRQASVTAQLLSCCICAPLAQSSSQLKLTTYCRGLSETAGPSHTSNLLMPAALLLDAALPGAQLLHVSDHDANLEMS